MSETADQGAAFADLAARYLVPLVLAGVVHLFAAFAFIQGWQSPSAPSAVLALDRITARMVTLESAAPEPAPEQQPAPSPVPQRRPEPTLQLSGPVEYVPIAETPEAPRPEPAEASPEPAPSTPFDSGLDAALEAEAELLQARNASEAAAGYVAAIAARIERNWSRPPSARNGMQAELLISLVPTGELVNVVIVRSSGNDAFDRSAERAVRMAAPFEVPEDPLLFERDFRQLRLLFHPEDLRL